MDVYRAFSGLVEKYGVSAKNLRLEITETAEQVKFLRDIGCDMFQGYYFAKPMRVSDFEEKYM